MPTMEDAQQALYDVLNSGVQKGLLHNAAEDAWLDGRTVTVAGQRLVNFGSCSYLGLEMHPALREGVHTAVDAYGTQFSSSRAYLASPLTGEVEEALAEVFGRSAPLSTSTTMGHLSALPVLIGPGDALLLDHQVHHSVQMAAKLVRAQGTHVDVIRHSDLGHLERRINELSRTSRRIWYAADGLYSMYADFAPAQQLSELVSRHEQLWLYVDDAHGVSWTGRHGRGYALEHLSAEALERTVVAASLNKSFAAAGGALLMPNAALRRRVLTIGGPHIFSGPIQPPMLGAALASARLHLTEEVAKPQRHLLALIRLFNTLAREAQLPLVSDSEAPIRCIGVGRPPIAYDISARLRDAGFFVDVATFPAVPAKRSGARVTLTAHHTTDDVRALVAAIVEALPASLAAHESSPKELNRIFAPQLRGRQALLGGGTGEGQGTSKGGVAVLSRPSPSSRLRLERHNSIRALSPFEWNALLGSRGTFTWDGLALLEDVFTSGRTERPEDVWQFSYWVVRDDDREGRAVAATYFTSGLWKDDMLSPKAVSVEAERRRSELGDPYWLTSQMLGLGSLLTDGDHLYLDRTCDWRAALRLLLRAVREEEERVGAAGIVLRDLPVPGSLGDAGLHDALVGEGFARAPMLDTWVLDMDFTTDEEFLARLSPKSRYHQRRFVLGVEDDYRVEILRGGRDHLSEEELAHLHGLYRNVQRRGLALNTFPLPPQMLSEVLERPEWELVLLRLVDGPAQPVAFGVQFVGDGYLVPLISGLDYDYLDRGCYRRLLLQTVRDAQRHGVGRVLLGMGADLEKRRFGARPEPTSVYLQATETYNADVLARLTEDVRSA